jgi:hypothetical protein
MVRFIAFAIFFVIFFVIATWVIQPGRWCGEAARG